MESKKSPVHGISDPEVEDTAERGNHLAQNHYTRSEAMNDMTMGRQSEQDDNEIQLMRTQQLHRDDKSPNAKSEKDI